MHLHTCALHAHCPMNRSGQMNEPCVTPCVTPPTFDFDWVVCVGLAHRHKKLAKLKGNDQLIHDTVLSLPSRPQLKSTAARDAMETAAGTRQMHVGEALEFWWAKEQQWFGGKVVRASVLITAVLSAAECKRGAGYCWPLRVRWAHMCTHVHYPAGALCEQEGGCRLCDYDGCGECDAKRLIAYDDGQFKVFARICIPTHHTIRTHTHLRSM